MEIKLKKRPDSPVIVEGFPGFGLVGTIATEFLVEHCRCENIGSHYFSEAPATIAVHEGRIIMPLNIHYNEEKNMVIVHAISGGAGMEWTISDFVLELARQLNAREILSLEGVGAAPADSPKVYYVATGQEKKEHLANLGFEELKEGILVGVTSALLMKSEVPVTALFAETHSELPDSKASAKLIEALNSYFDLKIDTRPLLEQAQKFEEKLNRIIQQGLSTQDQLKKKQLTYVG